MKKGSFQLFNNLQLTIFSISYVLSALFLFSIFLYFTRELQILFHVISTLTFLVLTIFVWTYLNIIFSIPSKMAGAFDPIKNKISTGETDSEEVLSGEIIQFLISFFNYSFFDVQYAAMKTGSAEIILSDDILSEVLDWSDIYDSCSKSEDIHYQGKVKVDDALCFAYTIPIYFYTQYLGYFTVFSMQPLGQLRLHFLSDLENNFIDDQLVRVSHGSK